MSDRRGRVPARAGWLMVAVACLAMITPMALAQDDNGGGRDRGRRGGFGNMTEEQREEFRKQMEERMAERRAEQAKELQKDLSLSDEEFEVIHPMIENARKYAREDNMLSAASTFGFGGPRGFGRRDREGTDNNDEGDRRRGNFGGRGGFGGFGGGGELSAEAQKVTEAMGKLREVVEKDGASADELKAAIAAVRAAKKAHRDARVKVQEELRSVLVTKQEAYLIASGVIE